MKRAKKGAGLKGGMNSAKGARTVRLPRAKSGLGFSIKGGKEHGIPIVVSWIQDGGAAGVCVCVCVFCVRERIEYMSL